MKCFSSFTSILILTGLQMIVENEALLESLLQRGGKSIIWTWSNQFHKTNNQRRRRFLADETSSSETWWKKMQLNHDHAANGASHHQSLSTGEETYFSGTGQHHPPPFDNPEENIPPTEKAKDMEEMERGMKDMSEIEREDPLDAPHDNLDTTLLRELIIEERHRPSKIELKSASQRLRDAQDKAKGMFNKGNMRSEDVEGSTMTDNADSKQPLVQYIVPGVEHVISHVEYVNDLDAYQESEEFRIKPTVEYVEPEVEFVEPEIGYLVPDESDNSTIYSIEEEERELEGDDFPVEEEYITIDQKQFLKVHGDKITSSKTSTKDLRTIRRTGSRTRESRRIHRRNPTDMGIPEVDYPTLEILPVVHFPCEEYTAPGYYADITSRCQMFHVCHEDGQRTSFLCPVGTVFNQEYLVCDWWYNVDCDGSPISDKPEYSMVVGGPDEKSLAAATADLKKKIDAVRLGEITHSKGYNRISAFPHMRNQETELNNDTNSYEEKSNGRLQNLSQKAMNYPMGYAILLRELIKNHENQGSDTVTTTEPTNYRVVSVTETMDDNAKDDNVNNLESRKGKIAWSSKQKNGSQRERNRQEYFGGSKPFTVAPGKKVFKNVRRIKRIKLKYIKPNSQDSFIQNSTKPPFAKTIRYEHWPGRRLPRPEMLISRQRTSDFDQRETAFVNSKETEPTNYPQQNRWIFAEPLINLNQRNDQNFKNITDDFEVIYPPSHQNYQHTSMRNRINLKDYNYNYNSAESNVEQAEKKLAADNLKPSETSSQEYKINRENSSAHAPCASTKKPSEITTYIKSATATKKAYILEPEPYLVANRNIKYGERLSSKLFSFAVHPEKVSAPTKVPIFEKLSTIPRIVNATKEKQSLTEVRPVYLNNERYKVSEKGLKSILGMRINDRPVTQPSPVYLGTERRPYRYPKRLHVLSNETKHINSNKTESPEAAEFDYTSSFIKRISNLVSEIKSPGDSLHWNHTQNDNHFKKGKAYTISVRVEAKEFLNKTNQHPKPRVVHNVSSSPRNSKPWNIDFFDGPVSPRTFHASYNRKKPFIMDDIKEHNVSRNNSRINNSHGGFVLKKVRLKRAISPTPSFENKPALSTEKWIQYFRDRIVTFLRRILKVIK